MTSGTTQCSIAASRIFPISALAGWRFGLSQVSAMSQTHHLARQAMLALVVEREEATLGAPSVAANACLESGSFLS